MILGEERFWTCSRTPPSASRGLSCPPSSPSGVGVPPANSAAGTAASPGTAGASAVGPGAGLGSGSAFSAGDCGPEASSPHGSCTPHTLCMPCAPPSWPLGLIPPTLLSLNCDLLPNIHTYTHPPPLCPFSPQCPKNPSSLCLSRLGLGHGGLPGPEEAPGLTLHNKAVVGPFSPGITQLSEPEELSTCMWWLQALDS